MVEIDYEKEKKSSFESESINFLEEKESTTESVSKMESELDSLTNDLSERRLKLESAISDSADEKQDLDKLKNEKLSGISDSIISIYDKIQLHRDGLAVVEISGGGCGGCGAHVPPQKITEIKAKEGIHRCDVCGRFLYNNAS